ncbi:MAG: ABC transporter substrate-binding protein [Brachymonas sp.]|nr:ABC transporter substrate-binding protein [Brachymonas sp.]
MNSHHFFRFLLSLATSTVLLAGGATAQNRELVVAQVAPFGGPLAVSGRDFNLGAMIAFDEVNSQGGIRGTPVRLISRDDGYRPADTVAHVKDVLANYNPVALLGMWGSDSVQAVLDSGALTDSGLAVIGVRSGVSSLRSNTQLFHIRASYRDEVQRILDQIATMGSSRIAFVYEDDAFGREAIEDAKTLMAVRNIKPALLHKQGKNQLDVANAIAQIAPVQPQALIIIANTPVAAALIKGVRTAALSPFIFTTSTVDAEQMASQLGGMAGGVAVAQGVPSPYRASAPIALEFSKRIRDLGIDPARVNFSSMEGYVTAKVLIEGLRRSAAVSKGVSRKDVVKALEGMQRTDLGGFVVEFAANKREGSRYVNLSMIGTDGRIRQ